jgi:hypothetical protein
MHRLSTNGGLNFWGLLALILFASGMYFVLQAAKLIVDSYGLVGTVIALACIFTLGFLIEARTKTQK